MRVRGQYVLPKVLSTLGNAGLAILSGADRSSRGAHRMFRTFDELQTISDERLYQTVRYAIGKKYIRISSRGDKQHIELTNKGKRLAGREAIAQLRPRAQKWDRKWRLVLFDIPEEFKKSRDGFASDLKRIGFVPIQKSAFVFPHPCFEELEVVADFHGVGSFVTFAVVEKLQRDAPLKRHFKL